MENGNKMSIARCLVELKTVEKRIDKSIEGVVGLVLVKGKNLPTGYACTGDVESVLKAQKQQVDDLIKRREQIKGAIVKANATTSVTVGKEAMTIAEAIDRKNGSVFLKKKLLAQLKQRSLLAQSALEKEEKAAQVMGFLGIAL